MERVDNGEKFKNWVAKMTEVLNGFVESIKKLAAKLKKWLAEITKSVKKVGCTLEFVRNKKKKGRNIFAKDFEDQRIKRQRRYATLPRYKAKTHQAKNKPYHVRKYER